MSKKDRPSEPEIGAKAPATKAKRKRRTLVRKTRYLALEQRIVFDGALAADIVDKTTQTPGDASKPAADSTAYDRTLPAVDWSQAQVPAATSSDGKSAIVPVSADKAASDEQADLSDRPSAGLEPAAPSIHEIVFIDSTLWGAEQLA